MDIRRRIRITNILMLLIPASLIVVSGGVIRDIYDPVQEHAELSGSFYSELYITMAEDPELLLEQSYLKSLECLSGYDGRINIYVSRERRVVNSIENVQGVTNDRNRYPMIVFSDWDFIFSDGTNGEFSLFVSDPERVSATFVSVGLVILAAIAVLFTANGYISWRLYKRISEPLKVLENAAHQIKEENLNTPVIYDQDDEYLRVCDAFEEMRLRLKESLTQQLKYEDNRKELLSSISHDLKTPITAIKGYVEGIRDGIADTPEKADKYMETIHAKAVQVDDLIDRLFFYSKLDMGKIPFQFRRLDLIAFLNDSFMELRLDYPQMELHFEAPDQEVFIQGDSTHLHRVITNLIGNAVKYSTDGRPVVIILAEKGSTMVELTLRDNGPGIDNELLPKMFERFYRGDASRSSRTEGSGLGLSIARKIIIAHGGTMTGRNSRGGGLEIHFSLRLADEEDSHH